MRDNRVRSVLVIDDDVLVGIVTQGDCAIKVLLPGLDAKQTPVGQVMTSNPVTVTPDDRLEGCMALMAERGFRHLPVLDAGKVVGVVHRRSCSWRCSRRLATRIVVLSIMADRGPHDRDGRLAHQGWLVRKLQLRRGASLHLRSGSG